MRPLSAMLMFLVLAYALYADFSFRYMIAIFFVFMAFEFLMDALFPDKEET